MLRLELLTDPALFRIFAAAPLTSRRVSQRWNRWTEHYLTALVARPAENVPSADIWSFLRFLAGSKHGERRFSRLRYVDVGSEAMAYGAFRANALVALANCDWATVTINRAPVPLPALLRTTAAGASGIVVVVVDGWCSADASLLGELLRHVAADVSEVVLSDHGTSRSLRLTDLRGCQTLRATTQHPDQTPIPPEPMSAFFLRCGEPLAEQCARYSPELPIDFLAAATIGGFIRSSLCCPILVFDDAAAPTEYQLDAVRRACSVELHAPPGLAGTAAWALLMSVISTNSHLRSLSACGVSLAAWGAAELGRCLRAQRALEELRLAFNLLVPSQGLRELLAGLRFCARLRTLDLGSNPLGDGGAAVVSATAALLPTLTSLLLDGCSIGDEGVLHLGRMLRRSASVELLDLSANSVGDGGADCLSCELQSAQVCLQELLLEGNRLSDQGATSFATALRHWNGSCLDLSTNPAIGELGARELATAMKDNHMLQSLVVGSRLSHLFHGLRSDVVVS